MSFLLSFSSLPFFLLTILLFFKFVPYFFYLCCCIIYLHAYAFLSINHSISTILPVCMFSRLPVCMENKRCAFPERAFSFSQVSLIVCIALCMGLSPCRLTQLWHGYYRPCSVLAQLMFRLPCWWDFMNVVSNKTQSLSKLPDLRFRIAL